MKQRYGTELQSRTLASIKPEISQALTSLLDEICTADDGTVLEDHLALSWAYCNIVGFHKGGACQYVHVEVLNDESFEGEISAFAA